MNALVKEIEVRWADLDPNFHVRHSAYYDYGANARIDFLRQHGITLDFMKQHFFGLVIFKEECVFKKELTMNDQVTVDMVLLNAAPDFSRWSIRHNIYKNRDTISAVLTLDGSWIDIIKRRLTLPPEEVTATFGSLPRDEHFEWIKNKQQGL